MMNFRNDMRDIHRAIDEKQERTAKIRKACIVFISFTKLSRLFSEANEAESAKFHAELLGNAEAMLQGLKIRKNCVVDVCTGDMGRGQVYKNDIEAWMPSRNAYGETDSCSTFHDFQSRRLNMRYKTKDGKNVFCHTLNNTCVALPRILIPILELYQNSDGSITVPEVLRKYMGQDKIVARG